MRAENSELLNVLIADQVCRWQRAKRTATDNLSTFSEYEVDGFLDPQAAFRDPAHNVSGNPFHPSCNLVHAFEALRYTRYVHIEICAFPDSITVCTEKGFYKALFNPMYAENLAQAIACIVFFEASGREINIKGMPKVLFSTHLPIGTGS